ncbi:uncharacterized protein DEA37_0010894 [Paragonimus westermani]|uniref:Tegument antigen n=1 Tax=Paragonimus westermani TaxID=34504 RepID=A0A5J4N9Y4_9TREM|nr:uncharacterized protein DEA37_0010894 [Paragonimus westermani]
MDGFVQAFFDIDKSRKEWLSMDELAEYMKENDLDEAFLERWQALFDPEKTGKIQLAKFCEVLGLQENTVREQFDAEELKEVADIASDMDRTMKVKVVRIIRKGFEKFPEDEKEMVKFVKQELDRTLDRLWHVVIVHGRYHSYYSYETGYNFCFKMNERIFIIYRSPDPHSFT